MYVCIMICIYVCAFKWNVYIYVYLCIIMCSECMYLYNVCMLCVNSVLYICILVHVSMYVDVPMYVYTCGVCIWIHV